MHAACAQVAELVALGQLANAAGGACCEGLGGLPAKGAAGRVEDIMRSQPKLRTVVTALRGGGGTFEDAAKGSPSPSSSAFTRSLHADHRTLNTLAQHYSTSPTKVRG